MVGHALDLAFASVHLGGPGITARMVTNLIGYSLRIKFVTAAVCDPPCQNGGDCLAPGHCSCPISWGGDRCETGAIQCQCRGEYSLILFTINDSIMQSTMH